MIGFVPQGTARAQFNAPRTYATPIGVQSVVAGDFNGDGAPDLAMGISGDGFANQTSVYVLLNNGKGSFHHAGQTFVAGAPLWMVVGDFNGDGKLDIAASGSFDGYFTAVLLGNGDGTFQPPINVSGPVGFIATGDFNGDGKLDLAITNGAVSVLLGNGDGSFGPAIAYGAGSGANSVAVADLNGDGKLDLAVTYGGSNDVAVLRGNGDGTFGSQESYSVGVAPACVATGDFNADGILDLAVANSSSGTVSVLFGSGSGNFESPVSLVADSGGPQVLIVADFNSDGIPDIATLNEGSNTASIFLSLGNEGFAPVNNIYAIFTPVGMSYGDFNLDGTQDLAFVDNYDGEVGVVFGNGHGYFNAPKQTPDGGVQPYAIVAGDLTGRGTSDLALVNYRSGTLTAFGNATRGLFRELGSYAIGVNPRFVTAGDLNNDGILDLIVTSNSSQCCGGMVSVLLGTGGGFYRPALSTPYESAPYTSALGDFNHDGKLDVVVGFINMSRNFGVVVFLGNGDGTFAPGVYYATKSGTSSVAVADLNADGNLDIVTGSGAVLLGNGDGTFQAPQNFGGTTTGSYVAVADFNGDSKLDLVIGASNKEASILLGNGDGTFQAPVLYPICSGGEQAVVADWNHDGALDIAVACQFAGGISVLSGKGDGTFGRPTNYLTGGQAVSLAVGDFNSDGRPDIAVANYGDNSFTILTNTTP